MTHKYSTFVAAEILALILEGGNLTNICKQDDFPSYGVVQRWLKENDGFYVEYQRVRQQQADAIYDEICEVERCMALTRFSEEKDGEKIILIQNPDWLDAKTGRFLINSMQWRASKRDPTSYGDKIKVETEDISLQEEILKARERANATRTGIAETPGPLEDGHSKFIQ